MPRYDYKCTACGRVIELMVLSATETSAACPCGGVMEKQPCAPNFVLRGPGFHVNDYPKR
jgi:putative FmdB family regulatory protein